MLFVRELLNVALVVVLLNLTFGCTSINAVMVTNDEATSIQKDEKIISATLVDGRIIKYRRDGGHLKDKYGERSNVIVGFTTHDSLAVINLTEVREVTLERREANKAGNIILIVTGVLIVAGLILVSIAKGVVPVRPF